MGLPSSEMEFIGNELSIRVGGSVREKRFEMSLTRASIFGDEEVEAVVIDRPLDPGTCQTSCYPFAKEEKRQNVVSPHPLHDSLKLNVVTRNTARNRFLFFRELEE
jgi:hypothetical protein